MDGSSAYERIKNELSFNETLLWSGAPTHGAHISGRSVYNTVFGIFFLGFALFWTASAATASPFMAIFGIPFIAAGIYVLFGQSLSKKSTVYGITESRIIIISRKTTESIPFSSVRSAQKRNFSDGSGDIILDIGNVNFYSNNSFYRYPAYRHGYDRTNAKVLFSVPEVDKVYRIINERLSPSF